MIQEGSITINKKEKILKITFLQLQGHGVNEGCDSKHGWRSLKI